jgi:hypothetical protein
MNNQEPNGPQPPEEDLSQAPASPQPVQDETPPVNNPPPQKIPKLNNTTIAFRDQQIALSMNNSSGPY